jgi:hypothetical protein
MKPTLKQRKRRASKQRTAFRNHARRRKPGDAHTIPSFCRGNAISESTYYALKRRGLQPREIEIDGRVIITPEAEADWRREREAATMEKRQREAEAATMEKRQREAAASAEA